MIIARDIQAVREAIRGLRKDGKPIAFVPTMGALHAGHLALVEEARRHTPHVVASIFVNPAQFGPNEDFQKYPRTEEADIQALKSVGTSVAYLPAVAEMYPEGAATTVHLRGLSEELCGAYRPGHFAGVATIVTKLFNQITPDIAVFGEKDYQQLTIIRRVVADLDMQVRIIGLPTVRESDGLALSSRNRYLSDAERRIAPVLYLTLNDTAAAIINSGDVKSALKSGIQSILSAGFGKVDYLELRDAATLAPVEKLKKPARLLVAAHLGTTRLIDNIEVHP